MFGHLQASEFLQKCVALGVEYVGTLAKKSPFPVHAGKSIHRCRFHSDDSLIVVGLQSMSSSKFAYLRIQRGEFILDAAKLSPVVPRSGRR